MYTWVTEKIVKVLKVVAWTTLGFSAIVIIALSADVLLTQRATREHNKQWITENEMLEHLIKESADDKRLVRKTDKNRDPFMDFQSELRRSAQAAGCAVKEYSLSPDRQGFVSNYSQRIESDFSVYGVKATLVGTYPQVMASLEGISQRSCIFEIDSLDLNRDAVSDSGIGQINASVAFRLIVRNDEGLRS